MNTRRIGIHPAEGALQPLGGPILSLPPLHTHRDGGMVYPQGMVSRPTDGYQRTRGAYLQYARAREMATEIGQSGPTWAFGKWRGRQGYVRREQNIYTLERFDGVNRKPISGRCVAQEAVRFGGVGQNCSPPMIVMRCLDPKGPMNSGSPSMRQISQTYHPQDSPLNLYTQTISLSSLGLDIRGKGPKENGKIQLQTKLLQAENRDPP